MQYLFAKRAAQRGMELFGQTDRYCKRCGWELDGTEESCPRCGFNPRQKGVRVSMMLFMGFILLMTAVIVVLPVWNAPGPYLIALAAVAFVLAIVTFLVSLVATPHRLGWLFNRF